MTRHLFHLFATSIILLGLGSTTAMAQPSNIDVPPVPPNLEVPSGHSVFLEGHATGTQNYVCLPTTEGLRWRFLGPQATLFQRFPRDRYQQLTTHFLSANPSEDDLPRPTWQHSWDSSQVWGRVIDSSSDPAFVEPGAISWLLLEAAGAELGPAGGSLLTQTTFIQRLNTSGGVAPSAECSAVGSIALVPYTTRYFFYRPSRGRGGR